MASSRVNMMAAAVVLSSALSSPEIASAQRYEDASPSVVVECGPGQRAVMQQRRVNGESTLVARCVGASRVASRRSVERAPRRTKTKTALMIAGSTAAGAGVGGALRGGRGALVGAAIGGGAASIYEAAKRR
jgi:hypothetical protein